MTESGPGNCFHVPSGEHDNPNTQLTAGKRVGSASAYARSKTVQCDAVAIELEGSRRTTLESGTL